MSDTLEELLNRGEIEYALLFHNGLSEREVTIARTAFEAGRFRGAKAERAAMTAFIENRRSYPDTQDGATAPATQETVAREDSDE
jgi:hypothetical protein